MLDGKLPSEYFVQYHDRYCKQKMDPHTQISSQSRLISMMLGYVIGVEQVMAGAEIVINIPKPEVKDDERQSK